MSTMNIGTSGRHTAMMTAESTSLKTMRTSSTMGTTAAAVRAGTTVVK